MKLSNINPYDPNMSNEPPKQEFPPVPSGMYTFQVVKIKENPLDISGKAGETIHLKIIGGDYSGNFIFLSVYTKHPLAWKKSVSNNLLAGLIEYSGNKGISDTTLLINSIVCGEVKQTTGKDGRIWCNIVKFYESKKDTQPEFNDEGDIPF